MSSLFQESLLDGAEICPGLAPPPPSLTHGQTLRWIEEEMPPEDPNAFGLHPNAALKSAALEAQAFRQALLCLQVSAAVGTEMQSVCGGDHN